MTKAARKDKAMNMDQLAKMVAAGFDNTATKDDLEGVRGGIKRLEQKVGDGFSQVDKRLGIVETKLDKALYQEMSHIEARVKRLEQKVGIK